MAGDASGSGPDDRDDDARDNGSRIDPGNDGSDREGTVSDGADRGETGFVFGETRPVDDASADGERERIPIDRTERAQDDESAQFGPEPSSTPVEPGEPSLENAVFVLLGVVLMVLVILRLVSLFPL